MESLKSEKAQELHELQQKEFITVSEFEIIYGYGKTHQKSLRARLRDPIPFSQKVSGGKILYSKRAVEKWMNK